jgi:hypothetical protein
MSGKFCKIKENYLFDYKKARFTIRKNRPFQTRKMAKKQKGPGNPENLRSRKIGCPSANKAKSSIRKIRRLSKPENL